MKFGRGRNVRGSRGCLFFSAIYMCNKYSTVIGLPNCQCFRTCLCWQFGNLSSLQGSWGQAFEIFRLFAVFGVSMKSQQHLAVNVLVLSIYIFA